MVATIKQWKVVVMKYRILFVLSIVQTLQLVNYFVRIERSLVVVKGCEVKINDKFLFRAYLNASDFHDVDWKNMDDGRGMD